MVYVNSDLERVNKVGNFHFAICVKVRVKCVRTKLEIFILQDGNFHLAHHPMRFETTQ